jgi:hypothetical protein
MLRRPAFYCWGAFDLLPARGHRRARRFAVGGSWPGEKRRQDATPWDHRSCRVMGPVTLAVVSVVARAGEVVSRGSVRRWIFGVEGRLEPGPVRLPSMTKS